MRVRDILQRKGSDVVVIHPEATLREAVGRLNARRIGAVVVCDSEGRVSGILSERDILREFGARLDPADPGTGALADLGAVTVRDVMTTPVVTGAPDDDLNHVMSVMTENRIRHLPIVDGPALAGIISIGDAVKACVETAEAENEALKAYVQGGGY